MPNKTGDAGNKRQENGACLSVRLDRAGSAAGAVSLLPLVLLPSRVRACARARYNIFFVTFIYNVLRINDRII